MQLSAYSMCSIVLIVPSDRSGPRADGQHKYLAMNLRYLHLVKSTPGSIQDLKMPRPSKAFHLHPDDHVATDLPQPKFDVIAIRSGWAGRQACARLTKSGLSCLLIEDELIGGDCPFWACVPSKVLLRIWTRLLALPERGKRCSQANLWTREQSLRDGIPSPEDIATNLCWYQ